MCISSDSSLERRKFRACRWHKNGWGAAHHYKKLQKPTRTVGRTSCTECGLHYKNNTYTVCLRVLLELTTTIRTLTMKIWNVNFLAHQTNPFAIRPFVHCLFLQNAKYYIRFWYLSGLRHIIYYFNCYRKFTEVSLHFSKND